MARREVHRPQSMSAKPGQYRHNKTMTKKQMTDVRGTRMERTGTHTGRVHMEDGGYMEFKVDDPKKFGMFQEKARGGGVTRPTNYKATSIYDSKTRTWIKVM